MTVARSGRLVSPLSLSLALWHVLPGGRDQLMSSAHHHCRPKLPTATLLQPPVHPTPRCPGKSQSKLLEGSSLWRAIDWISPHLAPLVPPLVAIPLQCRRFGSSAEPLLTALQPHSRSVSSHSSPYCRLASSLYILPNLGIPHAWAQSSLPRRHRTQPIATIDTNN